MAIEDDCFYKVHYKSSTVSFWESCRDIDAIRKFLEAHEEKLLGVEITIIMQTGWSEVERAELARLKAKYEPNEKRP